MAEETEDLATDDRQSDSRSARIKKNLPEAFTVDLAATAGIRKGASLEADRRGDNPEPDYLHLGLVEPPFDMDALAQLMQESPEHWACVRQKADDAAGLGWDLVPVDDELVAEQAAEAQAEKDELLEFCQQPNADQDLREIFMNVDLDWEGIGNGYVEIARADKTDPRSKPIAMWHQPAYPIRVKHDGSGYVELKPTKNIHFRPLFSDPQPDPESPDQVMTELYQFKTYNPASPYYGIPDIAASFVSVRAASAADWWNYVFFLRHCVPEMVVMLSYDTDAYDAADLKKIRQMIEAYLKFEVRGQPHKTIVLQLPKGVTVEWKPLAMEQQREAQFREYRKELGLQIVRANRVPPNRVGIFADAGGTVQGNDAQIMIYKNSVIRPRQEQFENFMLRLFRVGFGARYWRFKFHEIDAQDEQVDSTIASTYGEADTVAPNESRKKIGLEPFPSPLFDVPKDYGRAFRDAILEGKLDAEQVRAFIENGALVVQAKPAGGADLMGVPGAVPGAEGQPPPVGLGLPAPAVGSITDYATGKMMEDSEHERIRQKIERELVEVYGYDKSQMDIEVPVQFGAEVRGYVDIAIYEQPPTPSEKQRQWRIAVEIKTPGDDQGLAQLESYMNGIDCRWGLWTDGNRRMVIERVGPNRFSEAEDIPRGTGVHRTAGGGNGKRPPGAGVVRSVSFERTNILQGARGRGTGR